MMTTVVARTPIERACEIWADARPVSNKGWYSARCTGHDDTNPSLSFRETGDGGVLLRCHAGCEREEILQGAGVSERDLFPRGGYKPVFKPRPKYELVDLAADKLIDWQFLFNLGIQDGCKWSGTEVVEIPYYDVNGERHPKVRIRKGPSGNKDSLWDKHTPGPLIPYGLNQLNMARQAGYLPLGEGESDGWTMWSHGLPFLGVPGANNTQCLDGSILNDIPRLYVIQEPDKAGQGFYKRVHKRLRETGYTGELFAVPFQKLTGHKDPNDLHRALKGKGFKEVIQQALTNAIPSGDEQESEEAVTSVTGDDQRLPDFVIEGQLREQVHKAIDVLTTTNQKDPRLFLYVSTLSKVERDETGRPIIMQINSAAMRNELNDAANFYRWKKKGEASVLVDAHPPKDLADQLLALPPGRWPFPPLKALVEAPVLRPDGSILDTPGYDEHTHLYYVPSKGMEQCKIPMNPTREEVEAATSLIKDIFTDFPLEGKADLANTIALLLTPFVRYAVKKDIQMAVIDATNAGTGKGLLTAIVSIAATGQTTTPMTGKRDDEEWRKAILTELLQGPRLVIIDNIRGILESSTLELILTGGGLNERILGQSKSAKPKNEATWMATGNNLLIGGDLARRCYRIRLIAKTASPEERTDFKIPDLEQWMYDHRPAVVSALLTIARAWYVAGKPMPRHVPNLGTFTNWAKTVGGILEYVGIEGFQGNREELKSRNNEEAREWEIFLAAWHEEYADTWRTASEIDTKINPKNDDTPQPPAHRLQEALPYSLKKALAEKPKSFSITFAIALGKRVQTVYGTSGLRIEKDYDAHKCQKLWRVMQVVAGSSTTSISGENTTVSSLSSARDESRLDHLQLPARSSTSQCTTMPDSTSGGSTGPIRSGSNEHTSDEHAGSFKTPGLRVISKEAGEKSPSLSEDGRTPLPTVVSLPSEPALCFECLDEGIETVAVSSDGDDIMHCDKHSRHDDKR